MKKHGFIHTHIDLHDDGSASIHHVHQDPAKDVKHAVESIDGIHDSIQNNMCPEEEQELEEKIHPGIHDEVAAMSKEEQHGG